MNAITIFSIISLLPILYPLFNFFKKRELNLWDFLLLFSCIFFSAIPAIYGHHKSFEFEVVVDVSFVLIAFHYSLLLIDIFFRKNHDREFRIINITYYLKHIKNIKINFFGKLLLAFGLVVSIVYYLPRMSIAVRMEETGIKANYAESSIAIALTSALSIIGVILTLASLTDLKRLKKDIFLIVLDIVYILLMFFMIRRMMVFALLQFAIVFYAIHRNKINKRFLIYLSFLFLAIIFIYFPFYNVIRWNKVNFNPRHPIESLVSVVEYGIKNYSLQQSEATQSTDERSLGLYEALYNLFHNCTEWGEGKLTIAAIDGAIPRVLNHGKGKGTELILERMTGTYRDQADSIPLEACGDFGSFGAFYSVFIFAFLFWIYEKYSYLYYKLFGSYLIPTFIMFELLSLTWNIEGNLGGHISFFFSSIFSIILLLILEHYKVIYIVRRHFIKASRMVKNPEVIQKKIK